MLLRLPSASTMSSPAPSLEDLVSPMVLFTCLAVMVNPLLWNVAAIMEFKTGAISRTFGGPRRGIVALAVAILSMNYLRTLLFYSVVDNMGEAEVLKGDIFKVMGYVFVVAGGVLVLTSGWKLGFFCTFLGDFFGILLDSKVTDFPFNFVGHPMYLGSAMIYTGTSLHHASPVALLLTGCIGFSYIIAAQFERPFTAKIYAERNKLKRQKSN